MRSQEREVSRQEELTGLTNTDHRQMHDVSMTEMPWSSGRWQPSVGIHRAVDARRDDPVNGLPVYCGVAMSDF